MKEDLCFCHTFNTTALTLTHHGSFFFCFLETAMIVLDSIESLTEMVGTGGQAYFSHGLAHAIMTLVQAVPSSDARIVILGTTSLPLDGSAAQALRLVDLFPLRLEVGEIGASAAQNVISEKRVFRDGTTGPFHLPPAFRISMRWEWGREFQVEGFCAHSFFPHLMSTERC
jgi:hypothetical protein